MENKLCSNCKTEKPLNEFHYKNSEHRVQSWCKTCVYASQRKRWRDRKKQAVQLMGGCCQLCGYDKNYSALEFHHRDPAKKDVSWQKLRLRRWSGIVSELKKCILLCSNCHMEVHNPECVLDGSTLDDNNFLNKDPIQPTGNCPKCSVEVFGTKYCSVACASIARRKVNRPSKQELIDLLENHSWCAIARKYSVSDKAVRKWAKRYELI